MPMHSNWNPWHGCVKCSEGYQHCYVYYLDAMRGKNGADIYSVCSTPPELLSRHYVTAAMTAAVAKGEAGHQIPVCRDTCWQEEYRKLTGLTASGGCERRALQLR